MHSSPSTAAIGGAIDALRRRLSLLPFIICLSVVSSALGQESLPVIDVGRPIPTETRAENTVVIGGVLGQSGEADDNGTGIGPGRNGEICADGICNNPTSYA